MAKRQRLSVDDVMDVLSDDEDYDPDEPMMEGSDDEFSDLEMDECDYGNNDDIADFSDPSAALPRLTSPTHGSITANNTPGSLFPQPSLFTSPRFTLPQPPSPLSQAPLASQSSSGTRICPNKNSTTYFSP